MRGDLLDRIRLVTRALVLLFLVAVSPSRSLANGDPLVVALLLDTSGSIRSKDLVRVQTLTHNLVTSLPAGHEVAIYKFADDSRLVLEKTAQLRRIEQTIGTFRREGRFTALYDALFDASQYLERQVARRRAILLLTDGKNEGGQMSLGEGLEIARKQKIPIFTIGMGKAINQRALRRIAEQTGGTYSDLSTINGQDLAKSVQRAFLDLPEGVVESARMNGSISIPQTRPNRASDERNYWLAVLLTLAGSLGGLLFWWIVRTSKPRSFGSSSDHTATAWMSKQESTEEVKTVQASLLNQVPPTVRLQLQGASLMIKAGDGEGQIFPISSIGPTLLGRSPSAQVPFEDPAASSEHCQIIPDGGGYVLRDLKSTNGTTINRSLVKEHHLKDGDLVQVGYTTLRFSLSREAPSRE